MADALVCSTLRLFNFNGKWWLQQVISSKTICGKISNKIYTSTFLDTCEDVSWWSWSFKQKICTTRACYCEVYISFRLNRDNELNINRRIVREREITVIIYSTLKLYERIRSKTLINHFFCLGLCLLYDHVLEITKELSDTEIKHYMNTNVIAPSTWKKIFFTV